MARTSKSEKAAKSCGMTAERWSTAKVQAQGARVRGRKAVAPRREDGEIPGQLDLFGMDD
jgi:hypothetical protein